MAHIRTSYVVLDDDITIRVTVSVGPDRHHLRVVQVNGQWRTAWMHEGGRRKAAFGEPFVSGTAAASASRYLNERIFGPAAS